jgi:hypothetical protein
MFLLFTYVYSGLIVVIVVIVVMGLIMFLVVMMCFSGYWLCLWDMYCLGC